MSLLSNPAQLNERFQIATLNTWNRNSDKDDSDYSVICILMIAYVGFDLLLKNRSRFNALKQSAVYKFEHDFSAFSHYNFLKEAKINVYVI